MKKPLIRASGLASPKQQHNWDWRAASNFIAGGAGGGLLLCAALAGLDAFATRAAILLALILIGSGLTCVWFEIGRPWRALNVYRHFATSWMTREAVVALGVFAAGGLYEHSPWIAKTALAQRPFVSLPQLKFVLAQVVSEAPREAQLGLIRAHPELAGKAMVSQNLTAESTVEQNKAGLTHCSADEFARLQQLNAAYNAKFGWPFILGYVARAAWAWAGPRSLPRLNGACTATPTSSCWNACATSTASPRFASTTSLTSAPTWVTVCGTGRSN